MSSIINILLPNINSVRLNFNLISTQNHCSCFSLPTHDIVLSLMISLKTNSPLILFQTALDQSNLSSYRPISHISSITKTSERVIANQLINHIMSNAIFDKYRIFLIVVPKLLLLCSLMIFSNILIIMPHVISYTR